MPGSGLTRIDIFHSDAFMLENKRKFVLQTCVLLNIETNKQPNPAFP